MGIQSQAQMEFHYWKFKETDKALEIYKEIAKQLHLPLPDSKIIAGSFNLEKKSWLVIIFFREKAEEVEQAEVSIKEHGGILVDRPHISVIMRLQQEIQRVNLNS